MHQAEYREICVSEEQFAGDVRTILDSVIDEGVHFELGNDRAALGKLITVLGIDEDIENITQEGRYLNFIKAMHGSGSTSGETPPEIVLSVIKKHGIITALELLQSAEWRVERREVPGSRIVGFGDTITSQLMLMQVREGDKGVQRVDLDSTGIVIGMNCRMEVDSVTEYGHMNEDGLENIFKEVRRETDGRAEISKALGDYLKSLGDTLVFPKSSFYVRIGKVEAGGFFRGVNGVQAHDNYYDLNGGRFVRNAERSGDIKDDESLFEFPPAERSDEELSHGEDADYDDYDDYDEEDYTEDRWELDGSDDQN